MTLADIAAVYAISTRTARRWAAHDRWRRTGTRPVRYSLADAQQSYEAHKRSTRVTRHLTKKYAHTDTLEHS
jgi:uncharacterized protein YjcR